MFIIIRIKRIINIGQLILANISLKPNNGCPVNTIKGTDSDTTNNIMSIINAIFSDFFEIILVLSLFLSDNMQSLNHNTYLLCILVDNR